MKGRLNDIQKDYVLDHLSHHVELDRDLRARLRYGNGQASDVPGISFPAAQEGLDLDRVIWLDDIPVLYPVDRSAKEFYTLENRNLCFHHDLLKSIFHLLSGYEEVHSQTRDEYGRFPYEESLQSKLGIIDKPVVNYYIHIILKGLREFCQIHAIPFTDHPVFPKPVLMLSHDLDFIDSYNFKETAFKFKQVLGLAKSPLSPGEKIGDAFTTLFNFLNPFPKENPFWNFKQLMEWEGEREFRSTYFFLEKDGNYENSQYRFHQKKIRKLIFELSEHGHEIGIHGTMQSFDSLPDLNRTLDHLRAVSPQPVTGVRQHFLRFKPNLTAQIQAAAGLEYDASLGFSEHDGFRNSYCWPFKFYDFTQDRPMDFWEIPLTLMDVSHFHKRRLSLEESRKALEKLASEVNQFNGVFSLLWHNSFFDERAFPGITRHYLGLLDHLRSLGMEGIPGREILKRMKERETGNPKSAGS
jgi:hypothetical protein